MARQIAEFIENQFIQGLVTEATGLNFPEKAVIESWNTRFDKKGNVTRRLGYKYENAETDITGVYATGVCRSFTWRNPGKTDRIFQVFQTGSRIVFFEMDENGVLSSGKLPFSVNLGSHKTTGGNTGVAERPAQFAAADGNLYVAHPRCEAIRVEYDSDADDVVVTEIEIFIRDFAGVKDEVETDERPSTLSPEHEYNLRNQGWYPNEGDVDIENSSANAGLIDNYFNETGEYPSNCEVWWYYKSPEGTFKPFYRTQNGFGNSLAPKGHFIYNVFNIRRGDVSGVGSLDEDEVTTKRFSAIGFYAGRIWYGGIDDKIYYSQIIEGASEEGRCYQKNDPTNENLSDLLDTDGGVITVLGLNKAKAFFVFGSTLCVASEEGVWGISGSGAEGTGFVATDFAVRKISSVPMLNSLSLVDAEGTPIWWNLEGIWTIQASNTGSLSVTSVSEERVKTFINDEVSVQAKSYVQGSYNASERTIQWLFRSDDTDEIANRYKYDRILELNLLTGAFYPFKWTRGDQHFSTVFSITGAVRTTEVSSDVKDSTLATVVDSSNADVFVFEDTETTNGTSTFKYFCVNSSTSVCFVEESDQTYTDFEDLHPGGKDYTSYFISGASLINKGKISNVDYITVYCNTVNDGSILLQARWDWANSSNSNKWSTTQQCYTIERGYRDVSRKRLLIRGSGPAVQFKWSSVSGKPFSVIGWSGVASSDA